MEHPQLIGGGTWPLMVGASGTVKITSPVYDAASGYVFVGDNTGILHSVVRFWPAVHPRHLERLGGLLSRTLR